jgi:hypothetical protein
MTFLGVASPSADRRKTRRHLLGRSMNKSFGVHDLSTFVICGTCGDLRELAPQPGFPTPQRCPCHRKNAGDSKWDLFDFNEHFDLCRCCRMEALESGSRWSVWFCGECKERVLALNRKAGRPIVPIRRHSMMWGASLRGPTVTGADKHESDRLVTEFRAAVVNMSHAFERLDEFSRRRTEQLLIGLGFDSAADVPLPTWFDRLRAAAERDPARFGKRGSFECLRRSLSEGAT